jgi:hypothetical protein
VLKARVVQNSKNDLSEHDVHCRQRFEDHDDVQLMKFLDILVVVVVIIVIIVIVIVFIVLSSLFVASIFSI